MTFQLKLVSFEPGKQFLKPIWLCWIGRTKKLQMKNKKYIKEKEMHKIKAKKVAIFKRVFAK